MDYVGDFKQGEVIRRIVNVGAANNGTLSGGTPTLYKDADTASAKTGSGITVAQHHSHAGTYIVTIDTADANLTSGGYVANGADFFLVYVNGTIDGQASANACLMHFSLRNRRGIVEEIFGYVVENSKTFVQFLRIMKAVLAGKSTNNGKDFRDDADTKNRAAFTIDASRNRTAVTYDGS